MLFYHSALDQLAPVDKMRELAAKFCADDLPVHKTEAITGEHAAHLALGAPTATAYLSDRFVGSFSVTPEQAAQTG